MIRDILNYEGNVIGTLELPDNTTEEVWAQRLAFYAQAPAPEEVFYFPSLAVDFENTDIEIVNDEWVELAASRILWDTNNNYAISTNDLIVNRNGIYSFDIQAGFKELVNVKYVEIAVFKRGDIEDDYWFIVNKSKLDDGETEIHIGGNTSFDFYDGDQVCVKVKLHKLDSGIPCSGKIDGSDDYTAWGYNFIRKL